jgi:hypothetical protein
MSLRKSVLLGAMCLVGTALVAQAQPQYLAYPYPAYPYGQAPGSAQTWNYDPYTSGLAPCTQRWPGDPPCSVTMPPTYGQPDYRSTR